MCVTNIYTDRYPDGQEGSFRQFSPCPYGSYGQPCQNHEILDNYPREIQYGEPTSAQMFQPRQVLQTPPRSSSSSHQPSSVYASLESDDGITLGTGTHSSGGTHSTHRKKRQSAKSKAVFSMFGVKLESSADRRKRREREAKKDKVIVVDEYLEEPGSSSFHYTRPLPGPIRSSTLPRGIHFSEPLGVPYTPGPTRLPPTIVTQTPDTLPVIQDAFPSPRLNLTRDVFPQTATMRDAAPPAQRTVSPVRIPERERRPHGPVQPPVIHNRRSDPSPSPPPIVIRTPSPHPPPPPPAAPTAPAAAPIPDRSRSQSRVRIAPATPSPSRHRESSRDRQHRRRERSPEPPRRSRRRDDSMMRRQRFFLKDEEIRNRQPTAPRDDGIPRDVQLERERRPYITPVVEQTQRLHSMMGDLNIRDAGPTPPAVSRPVVDSDMIGRLRDRHAPLNRRNSVSTPHASGSERRREKHQVLYDDGTVRYE